MKFSRNSYLLVAALMMTASPVIAEQDKLSPEALQRSQEKTSSQNSDSSLMSIDDCMAEVSPTGGSNKEEARKFCENER